MQIKVPNWFPTGYQLRQWKRKLNYILFPPRCEDCKTRVKASRFYYKQYRSGTYPTGFKCIADFAIKANRTSCPSCIKKYLNPTTTGKCTICETENVPVMVYIFNREPKTSITFLWGWWNSGEFCMQCIDELLEKGEWATDYYVNGKPRFY